MPRPSSSDKRYLEQNHGKWRVTMAVPRALHSKLGTRLKRQLQTDSLAIANQLKWQVISELKAEIEAARQGSSGPLVRGDALRREALAMADLRARAQSADELETLDYAVSLRADALRGAPVDVEADHRGHPDYSYDPERETAAGQFQALAKGEVTPIDLHHAKFIADAGLKLRTQGDDRRAVKFLMEWCERQRVPTNVECITRKSVVRFVDELPEIAGVASPATLKKYLNRLSLYWRFLMAREIAASDPWHQSHRLLRAETAGPEERPFTDAEVLKLLTGEAAQEMQDVMRIGALTGARLDVIVSLRVKDCADGLFSFKPQKKEKGERAVPIHPALTEIITRRTEGRKPDDDMFPEWPAPKANSERERSFKTSNEFTIYRRKVGVDEVVPGKRRSLVNFHSFRRWFITKAEQADQPPHLIAAVVGHKREGLTLGRYSAGPLLAQARRVVEAVKLPTSLIKSLH